MIPGDLPLLIAATELDSIRATIIALRRKSMLQSLEAEVDVNGSVVLLEPVKLKRKTRAIVTLLEGNGTQYNSDKLLNFLNSKEFVTRKSYRSEEIEAQIKDARDSWE